MARLINRIIVHCSATPEGKDFHASDIDKWHRNRGFNSIGYHYVITLDGKVEQGRHEDKVGAHASGYNSHSIGVCYIGGVEVDGKTPKDTRTDAQKEALANLIGKLKKKHPGAVVHGHNEVANKACPCFNAREEYA